MGAITPNNAGDEEKITGFGIVGHTPNNAATRMGFTPSHAAGEKPMMRNIADSISLMSKSPMNAGNL